MSDENKITPQPEYDALYAFDAENNLEPSSVIAERIAAKHGFHDKHPIVDDIHYAIEDALDLGQRRGKLIPPPGTRSDPEMPPDGYSEAQR
jgi:hypothetical protein